MKKGNRIALIGWSIVAAVALAFVATISEARAMTDPYEKVGDMHKGAVMDAWNNWYSDQNKIDAVRLGTTCRYNTTALSGMFVDRHGTVVELSHTLIDEYAECEISKTAQMSELISTGFDVVPYFTNGARDLDPGNVIDVVSKEGSLERVADCVAEVYLVTTFLPVDEAIYEEIVIARVLDRQCTPIE